MDPAGPRFVDGPFLSAIPELADNILTKESAVFVDIIHTNGNEEQIITTKDIITSEVSNDDVNKCFNGLSIYLRKFSAAYKPTRIFRLVTN